MSSKSKPPLGRDEAIFARVIEGVSFRAIAIANDINPERVRQIFHAEAKRLYPDIAAQAGTVSASAGNFPKRFIEAFKAQEAAA